ncbi:hypothetical protein DH2020_024882 [Rehmannia glutinosa]|uniref:Protein TIME FOR COFFEE-like n=1 Tax=Rehmannia glutinosa TaxID=99300 RepID=A0ABR0W432_REHGL
MAISTVNGLPRRRQRVTSLRDSTDEDGQMELHETVRIRDREQLQKKDRDREFPKRRRVERPAVQQMSRGGGCYIENESTDSSDEEYFEEEVETRINQLSPTSLSLSNNRRGIRSLRSAPVLRTAVDEVLGVPVPRRARSASAKRLHEYVNSGSGGLGEDLSHRKFPPSPATVSLIGSGGASPSYSGASMKKKMKYVDRRTRVTSNGSNSKPPSVIQDDIEIEVAEALFDLMKQSHPQSESSEGQENVDRDSTNTADDDLKRLKAERGKNENDAFNVQNQQSIKVNAETILADSIKELQKEGRIEKEKFPDNPAQELVRGDGFVDKEKVGSPKESESPSWVKVNACDIQELTVTKADDAASVVEAEKESKIEIDLMSLPSLPSSPERDALLDIDPKVMTQDKSETTPKDDPLKDGIRIQGEKIGVMNSNQLLSLDLEKHRHDISSVSDNTTQQQQGRTEQKNQSPTSLLPFSVGTSGLPGVFPHPGYVPSQRAVFPIDGSARSSMIMQQLIKKSLSSGPTGAATLYAAKPLNLKSKLPTQRFITGNPLLEDFQGQNLLTILGSSGKDKSSDDAADFATTSRKSVHQQASHQSPANNLLHGPGFKLPLGHYPTTMMAPANSSGPPQSASDAARRLSVNSPVFNYPMLPSNDAARYMAILQNSGCPIPAFKGGSFLDSPFYNQHQLSLPHATVQSASQNTSTFSSLSSHKQPQAQQQTSTKINKHGDHPQQGSKNRVDLISQPFPMSFGANASTAAPVLNFSSMAQNSAIFQMLPDISWNGNQMAQHKNFPASEGKSDCTNVSATMGPSKFDSLGQTISFLPSPLTGNPTSLIGFSSNNHIFTQAPVQTDYSSFIPKWENFSTQSAKPTLVNIPQPKSSQGHHVAINSRPASSITGSKNTGSSSQRTASTISALASQETEASQNGPGQKSSPACRRNVPSILSTRPSQLSELKY